MYNFCKFVFLQVEGENNPHNRQEALNRLHSIPFEEIEKHYCVLAKVCGDHNNQLVGEVMIK